MNKIKKNFFSFYMYFALQRPTLFTILFIMSCISWPLDLVVMPYLNKIFVDRISQGGSILYILMPLSFLFMSRIFAHIVNRSFEWLWIGFIANIQSRIRRFLFGYIHGHSHKYFLDNQSGKLSQRLMSVVGSSEHLISFFMELLIPLSLGMGVTIFLTAKISYIFAAMFTLWFLVNGLIAYVLGPAGLDASKKYSDKSAALTGVIVDSIINALNIKIFSSPAREVRYIAKFDKEQVEAKLETLFQSYKIRILANVVDAMFFILFFFMLLKLHGLGRVTLGDFILIYGLYNNFGGSISWMGTRIASVLENIGSVNNDLSIMLADYEIVDRSNEALRVSAGEILFEDVTISYGEVKAVEHFNLVIRPKEKVGIVGASGAGKSSLLGAIMRFYDCEGSIRIDGQDISMVTQESLRANISYITQEPMLFSRSIRENIAYPKENASEEEIARAVELADAKSFIDSLPAKYDTVVGERGVKLSGGQRQRIAIARAIVKNAPILLMDEATSALDSETEFAIQRGMKNLMEGKTVLVIAHRLSTISSLDRLIVMDNGKIVEEGTHKELLKKDGKYAKLWKMQSDGFL